LHFHPTKYIFWATFSILLRKHVSHGMILISSTLDSKLQFLNGDAFRELLETKNIKFKYL